MTPTQVLEKRSRALGCRAAGAPGSHWAEVVFFVAQQPEPTRYIVCNADESEPGTFKDRLIVEGDPHAVLEGMALAGYAVEPTRGGSTSAASTLWLKDILNHAISSAGGDEALGGQHSWH